MTKYIVKCCPALINDDVVENGCYQRSCHHKDFFCKDRTDCKIKQIVGLCKSAVDICNCKDADKDIDCHWCKEGGRADIGRKILQILKTQEVK